MITTAVSYEYPMGGQYAETVGTLEDGRVVTIDTQYACVLPHGTHKADCDLDGIDVAALVADARANGKCGRKPDPKPSREEIERNQREIAEMDARRARNGLCPKCGTYCHGDCEAK